MLFRTHMSIVLGSLGISLFVTVQYADALGSEGYIVLLALWAVLSALGFFLYSLFTRRRDNSFNVARYDQATQTLTLYKRCPAAVDYIYLTPEISGGLKFDPAHFVSTSATVGCATVTRVEYKEDSYAFSNFQKTGAFLLCYGSKYSREATFKPISKILLGNHVVIDAANHDAFISQFREGDSLVLRSRSGLSADQKAVIESSKNKHDIAMAATTAMQAGSRSVLDKAACNRIRDWMSGK